MEVADNVIPSSNSEMAKIYSFRPTLIMLIIHRNPNKCTNQPIILFQLGTFRNAFIKPPFEIAIVGPTLKTPEKLSIKNTLPMPFSRWKTEYCLKEN
jgi:hypothetical protein